MNTPKRGAIPTPKHEWAAATPHVASLGAPLNFLVVPPRLSMWGNDIHDDSVIAEEAFAKGCQDPGLFISDRDVIAWATTHGALEGAHLTQVMQWMQTDGFAEGADVYRDGPYVSVHWTDPVVLKSAIADGPVKVGVAADQVQAAWHAHGGKTGWFGLGFERDDAEDHCASLCGYGTLVWLAQQLDVSIPAAADGASPGYAMFTWNSIGVLDESSMLAVTHEAWLRRPTTVLHRPSGLVSPKRGAFPTPKSELTSAKAYVPDTDKKRDDRS